MPSLGLSRWPSDKESACQCRRCGLNPWVRKMPWRRKWQPTPVFLPGIFHSQRSLAGYSPWGRRELDTTEHISVTWKPYFGTKLWIHHLPVLLHLSELWLSCPRMGNSRFTSLCWHGTGRVGTWYTFILFSFEFSSWLWFVFLCNLGRII